MAEEDSSKSKLDCYRSKDQLVSLIRKAAGRSNHIELNYVWENKEGLEDDRAYIELITYEKPKKRRKPTRSISHALSSRPDSLLDQMRSRIRDLMDEAGYVSPEKSEKAIILGYVELRKTQEAARKVMVREAQYLHDLVHREIGLDIKITGFYLKGDTANKRHKSKEYGDLLKQST